jgi:hypothetical protein
MFSGTKAIPSPAMTASSTWEMPLKVSWPCTRTFSSRPSFSNPHESSDGVTEHGLRHPELCGRPGKAPLAHNREEGKEVIQVFARHS